MLSLLIQKELKNILLSPKFVATFFACSVLILISVYIGINEYQNTLEQYEANQKIALQKISQAPDWSRVENTVHRKPTIMQIFVSGLHFDIGRLSDISEHSAVKLKQSQYSDEPLFAMFRNIDFSFIVQIIFSLFAILFTYDAINGERENGTLKLAFANSVSKAKYLIAKFSGIWLGLVIPLLIPILIAFLLLSAYNIPVTNTEWIHLGILVGLTILYITLFIGIGILVSTITRSSSLSFLLLLVIWIGGVFIVPRLGIMAAAQLVPVESIAQIEAKKQAYRQAQLNEMYSKLNKFNKTNITKGEENALLDKIDKESKNLHKEMEINILNNNRRLLEHLNNKKIAQQKLALKLARFSPVTSFKLGAMKLAATDLELKSRYEESMRTYRDDFIQYIGKKREETNGNHSSFGSFSGSEPKNGRDGIKLDTSDMLKFTSPTLDTSEIFASSLKDFSFLLISVMLSFVASFFAFLRYDVR